MSLEAALGTVTAEFELVRRSVLRKLTLTGRRELLERTKNIELLESYIETVANAGSPQTEFETKFWGVKGWRVCAVVAAPGMGKTAVLEDLAWRQHATDDTVS
eukprot:3309777-Amphidinium_carterae.1